MMYSPCAHSRPVFRAALKPPFGLSFDHDIVIFCHQLTDNLATVVGTSVIDHNYFINRRRNILLATNAIQAFDNYRSLRYKPER